MSRLLKKSMAIFLKNENATGLFYSNTQEVTYVYCISSSTAISSSIAGNQELQHNHLSSNNPNHIQHVSSNSNNQNSNHGSVNLQLPETGSKHKKQLLALVIGSIITTSVSTFAFSKRKKI